MKKIIQLLFVVVITTQVKAQDPEFTQFYANPLYLNPAFAGTNNCPRVALNYRNQWPGISGTYVTSSVSYDQHIRSIYGGVGLLVTNDQAAKTLSTLRASGIYAYQLPISRTFSARFGFEATFFQKSLDWSKLTFGDQIDPRRGFVYTTNDIPRGGRKSGVDFSLGALGFSESFYFGIAAHHVTEPDESLVQGKSPLPMKITGHAGAMISLNQSKYSTDDTKISPNILYRQQERFQQLNLGVYITKGPFWGGIWYRNGDAFIVLIGLQTEVFKVGYSYDVTTNKITLATAGSHELSVTMNFNCKPPRKKYRTISCPSF